MTQKTTVKSMAAIRAKPAKTGDNCTLTLDGPADEKDNIDFFNPWKVGENPLFCWCCTCWINIIKWQI